MTDAEKLKSLASLVVEADAMYEKYGRVSTEYRVARGRALVAARSYLPCWRCVPTATYCPTHGHLDPATGKPRTQLDASPPQAPKKE